MEAPTTTSSLAAMDQPSIPSAPSKRLVLHIGFHKTGTSAIQESLYGWRVRLRDFGVVYPQPISEHFSHLDLATALGFNPRAEELAHLPSEALIERYQRLIGDSPEGSTIILSSEEFCEANWRVSALDALDTFLAPLDVEVVIVAYVRSRLPFLLAIYHHEIRDVDSTASFAEWVETFPLAATNFPARLRPWRERFDGRAEIIVGDYEAARSEGTGVTRHLLDTVGLARVDLPVQDQRTDIEVHPHLVEPLIAVRRSDLPDERKHHLIGELMTISQLMPPVDAALHYLGVDGKQRLEERLERAPEPWPPATLVPTDAAC